MEGSKKTSGSWKPLICLQPRFGSAGKIINTEVAFFRWRLRIALTLLPAVPSRSLENWKRWSVHPNFWNPASANPRTVLALKSKLFLLKVRYKFRENTSEKCLFIRVILSTRRTQFCQASRDIVPNFLVVKLFRSTLQNI